MTELVIACVALRSSAPAPANRSYVANASPVLRPREDECDPGVESWFARAGGGSRRVEAGHCARLGHLLAAALRAHKITLLPVPVTARAQWPEARGRPA